MIERSAPFSNAERIGLAAGLALSAILMWPLRGHVTDQAFIHLQHARHLAEGRGLVFNVGEHVYGCSSPLWVALLADAIALGIDGVLATKLLGAAATLASVALMFQLARRTVRSPLLRAAATVAWATHPWMLEWSMSGREASLAVALMLGGFVAYTEGETWGSRPVRTGALWALAALTRPEAVLLLALWGILSIVDAHNRAGVRRLLFGGVTACAIYGAWLLFARVYYGTFWPQILSSDGLLRPDPESRWPNLIGQARLLAASDLVSMALLITAVAFCGRRWWKERSPAPLMQPALPWLWITLLPALYAARGVMAGTRHVVLLAPIIEWLAWFAASSWWLGPAGGEGRERRATPWAVALTAAILIQHGVTYRSEVLPRVLESSAAVERTLVHWGRWLGAHAPPGSVIAAPEVGAIAYYSRLRVIDVSGRVTPHAPADGGSSEAPWLALGAGGPRPSFLVEHGARPYQLMNGGAAARCLTPIGDVDGWTAYRIDWAECDRDGKATEPIRR